MLLLCILRLLLYRLHQQKLNRVLQLLVLLMMMYHPLSPVPVQVPIAVTVVTVVTVSVLAKLIVVARRSGAAARFFFDLDIDGPVDE